ncbi:MAG: hypothetical protein ACREUA_09485 [Burkholderiales bacterium]
MRFGAALALLFCTQPLTPYCGEMRGTNPVATPGVQRPGAQPLKEFIPIERSVVEKAVRDIYQSWNRTGQMENALSADFYDRTRVFDAIDEEVPRDARITILSIQGIQTLTQQIAPEPRGDYNKLLSRVSVTVRAEVTFNSSSGFQRREGLNELILDFVHRLPK